MLRRLSISDELTPTAAAAVSTGVFSGTGRHPGGYCRSIQRISIFATLNNPALFAQSGNSSSGSSGSSSPGGSETETPPHASPDASFKKLIRAEASSDLDEVASQMVRDGYTRSLVQAFSERDADDVLKSWFSELDVGWVLAIGDQTNLPEPETEWEAFDDLVQRWVRAVTLMAKALHMTSLAAGSPRPELQWPRRCPDGDTLALCSDGSWSLSSSSASDGSDSSTYNSVSSSLSMSVASVGEAMGAFSLAGTAEAQTEAQQFAMASVLKMLAFADAVAGVEKTRENLLRALDIYASISDLSPTLLQLFSGSHKETVSRKIQSTVQLLSDAVRAMVRDVKACLAAGDSLGIPQGGDIHRTTRCAMSDIRLLLHNYGHLDVAAAAPKDDDDDGGGCMFSLEGFSSLGDLLVELIYGVEDLLVEKSRAYSDPGLRYIFLLNNLRFVLQQVESMDLQSLVQFRKQKIEHYIEKYIESCWLGVVSCLLSPAASGKDGRRHRSRRCHSLARFNSELERACSAQRHWKVPCPELRERLRQAIAARVVAEYSKHLADYPELRSSAGYTTPRETEELLAQLFEG